MIELQTLTTDEFARFAKLVYSRTGIHLAPEKLGMLSNRLRKRLKALNLPDFEAYFKLMSDPRGGDEELPNFLTVVTTNETYFFRNDRLWELMKSDVIPSIVARKKTRPRSVRVWSAAASSGEEAYSCAISLRENLPDWPSWDVSIVGTDISRLVLDKAASGVYGDYAVGKISPERLSRWFDPVDNQYKVKSEIRKLVNFKFHNLQNTFEKGTFDFVLLRNVLMYFDTPMKLKAIHAATQAVVPGGFLFVGDVDPIPATADLKAALTFEFYKGGLYRRPAADTANAKVTACATT